MYLRLWRTKGLVALGYGLALLPAVGLVVHVGDEGHRLSASLVTGKAALFGLPLAAILTVIAAGIAASQTHGLRPAEDALGE